MKLHWSPRSPFVRKVMIVAYELGLADRISLMRTVASSTAPNPVLMADNPLNKIPTLVLDDGTVLHDSRVICEYLGAVQPAPALLPASGPARWSALRRQALADGLCDLLLLWRQERERPAQSALLLAAFEVKCHAALQRMESEAASAGCDIGHIAGFCALAYLDFRFADLAWRPAYRRLHGFFDAFADRPSARATVPHQDAVPA